MFFRSNLEALGRVASHYLHSSPVHDPPNVDRRIGFGGGALKVQLVAFQRLRGAGYPYVLRSV